MPVYEYRCTKCSKEFEVTQKMTDSPLTICSSCGGELKKLITKTSFVLKGSGWYVTDYPSPERKKAMDAKKSSDKKPEPAGAKKEDKKPEKKTDTSKAKSAKA